MEDQSLGIRLQHIRQSGSPFSIRLGCYITLGVLEMATSFCANTVTFVPIEGVLTVGFSEHLRDTDRYLLLQRKKHESDEDRKLGMVGEYVEFLDQSRGAYHAIESALLQRNSARFLFSSAATTKVKEREVVVSFELNDNDFLALTSALRQILGTSRVHVALDTQLGRQPDAAR
jgi:hypothetical protein